MVNIERLRQVEEKDLSLLLRWRNHPDIRQYMYTQHEITLHEHKAWFKRMQENPQIHLLMYVEGGIPRGYAQLTVKGHRADWGFYVAPDARKGTGRKLGKQVLEYAFNQLQLKKVCGEALSFNEGSIAFHKSLGFMQEGTLRAHACIRNDFIDVFCFGLLKTEWLTKEKEL